MIAGTSIGTNRRHRAADELPPFRSSRRLVENAIREVDSGLIEAARAMGANPAAKSSARSLIPEALPSITLGLTLAVVSLIGYSAMVGAVGGEGLGDLGIRYGYQRFMPEVMAIVVIILIVLVQLVQSIGEWIAARVGQTGPPKAADNKPVSCTIRIRSLPHVPSDDSHLRSCTGRYRLPWQKDIKVGVSPGETR